MTYSNDPVHPSVYASVPSPLPNIDFPKPYWINKLKDLIILGCMSPDLAYGALLIPAALRMLWSLETPSTKQLVEQGTGRSWLCSTKQTLSGVEGGSQIASSSSGRFIYGLLAGLDIAAYYAFMISTGAQGVVDYGTFAGQFQRRCNGNQSQWRGVTPVGGWAVPNPGWATGPSYLNSAGALLGPLLVVGEGQMAMFLASCSFSGLFGTGGVLVEMRLRDTLTDTVLDFDVVDNLFNTSSQAIVQFFSFEGLVGRDMNIVLEIRCNEAVENRMGTVDGICYIKAWDQGDPAAPPFFNARTNKKSWT